MKKLLLSLFLISGITYGQGDPAPYIKGQSASGLGNIGSTIIVPNNQSTKINSYKARIETGNANVLADPSAEGATTPWIPYADAVSDRPTDGTGCLVTCAITVSNSATTPLAGAKSLVMVKDAVDRQGQGIAIPFTISEAEKTKVLQVTFDYKVLSGTYADNDVSFWIYDLAGNLIQPAPYLLKNAISAEKMSLEFQASTSTSYRLIAHVTSGSPLPYSLQFDNLFVGRQAKNYGSPITDAVAKTYTLTNAGNATVVGTVAQVGENAVFSGTITIGSTVPTTTIILNLPSGYSLSTAGEFKDAVITLSQTTNNTVGAAYALSVTSFGFFGPTGFSGASWGNTGVPSTLVAGNTIKFTITAKVQGFSSSTIMSSDADTRVVAFNTEAFNVPYPAVTTPIIINFTPNIDTHSGYNSTTGEYTIKVPGIYKIQGNVIYNIGSSATGTYINASVYINGSPYNPTTHRLIAGSVSTRVVFNKTDTLKAGDVITLRILATNATLSVAAASLSSFSVERLSGPSQIAASESVSALYTGAPPTIAGGTIDGTARIVTFGTRVKDSHNSYSGGLYTAPSSGVYDISSSTGIGGTFVAGSYATMTIAIDGVDTYVSVYLGTASSVGLFPTINIKSIPLRAGQTVSIKLGTQAVTSSVFNTSASVNYFSLTRSGNY